MCITPALTSGVKCGKTACIKFCRTWHLMSCILQVQNMSMLKGIKLNYLTNTEYALSSRPPSILAASDKQCGTVNNNRKKVRDSNETCMLVLGEQHFIHAHVLHATAKASYHSLMFAQCSTHSRWRIPKATNLGNEFWSKVDHCAMVRWCGVSVSPK